MYAIHNIFNFANTLIDWKLGWIFSEDSTKLVNQRTDKEKSEFNANTFLT